MAPRLRLATRRSAVELPYEAPPAPEGEELGQYRPRINGGARPNTPAWARQMKVSAYLQLSKKRFQTSDAATWTLRRQMRQDQLFASGGGNQWETEDKQARSDEGRPCLEINRIPQFIRQVSNQNRANRTQIKINARGKGATVKLATAIQALVRSVEVESDADVAYDTATDHQLRSGLGFTRLYAKWTKDDPFQQCCAIGRIRNPLSVYWDPSTQEADFSDCRWMHIIGVIGKDEYESRWGKWSSSMGLPYEFVKGDGSPFDDWAPEGKVMIAEYYTVEIEQKMLLKLSTGANVYAEELEKYLATYQLAHPGEMLPEVVREREVDARTVYWSFHNGIEILEGNDDLTGGRRLPGTRIPIYPLIGDEYDLDGNVDYRGMVRDARDPQKMYNFWSSSIAEAVALAPKAPWIAAKGQVEQYIDDWKDANRRAKAVLVYDPKAVGDTLVPAPQRNAVEPAIQAMVAGLMQADRDLKSVMGLFEPSLGERNKSDSGKAILAMQQQGQIANSNFLDNLQRMKRSIGRSLLEWIPEVYDVARVEHLVQPDGKRKESVIYSGEENKPSEEEFPDISDMYDVSVGHFDVTVSTGMSFQSEQEQTRAWLLDLFKVLPPLAAMGADILLENSDNPAAQQLAARYKKSLPPAMQDESDPAMAVPMLQNKLQQAQMLLEKANQAIGTMAKVIDSKELENETKRQVAMIQQQGALLVALAKIEGGANQAVFDAEVQRFIAMTDQIHQDTVMDMEQQNAEKAADKAQQHSVESIREQRAADEAVAAAAPAPQAKQTGA